MLGQSTETGKRTVEHRGQAYVSEGEVLGACEAQHVSRACFPCTGKLNITFKSRMGPLQLLLEWPRANLKAPLPLQLRIQRQDRHQHPAVGLAYRRRGAVPR